MTDSVQNPPKRVVHVTQTLELGGLEKLLIEFARHTDRGRFDLHFVSLSGRGVLAEDLEACGWPVTSLQHAAGLRPRLLWRLTQLFRSLRADVVHTHDDRPLIYGALAARLARVKHVLHTRHGQSKETSRRQRKLIRFAARRTDHFVCVSRDSARLAVENGMPAAKVSTLWNGIDLDRFACSGPRLDGPVVTVARLNPEKDIATLVRAVALAIRECHSLRLEIAGDGVCLSDLKALVAERKLTEQVRFLGAVRDVPALLERASLFVLPSLSEGVSLTLLEAMARGLPVVATNVGGTPEVVVDGVTGLLVPAASPSELARAMLRLLANPEMARQIGHAGRERVEAHFDVRRMVGAYERLYLSQTQEPLAA